MTSKKNRDVSVSVTAFYLKIIGFWLADTYEEKRRRKFAQNCTILMLMCAVLLEVRDIYHIWGDFGAVVYVMCNILTVGISLFKILVSMRSKEKFLELIKYARTNFWHSDYDSQEQMIVNECKRSCTFLICVFNFFANGTVSGYIIRPIVESIGKNESDRILIVNFWIDFPTTMTPYYEILFTSQVFIVMYVCISYLCIDNFLCMINLHTATQFRILQYRLSNVCGANERSDKISKKTPSNSDECYAKFKNCIQQHQALIEYCNELQEVFGLFVLAQVLLFSLLMCLDGYLVMEDTPIMQRLTFLFHLTGCLCQLLMFTYSCDCLIRESLNVANAIYDCSWIHLPMDRSGRMLRKDLTFVIGRSRVPCCLTACGFFPVSLETYTSIKASDRSSIRSLQSIQRVLVVCEVQCPNVSVGYQRDNMKLFKTDDLGFSVTSMFVKMIGLWMAKNQFEQHVRNVTLFYTFFFVSFGFYVEATNLYHSWGDLSVSNHIQGGVEEKLRVF
ncbi:Odorant receptor Or2 [Habropoda laboriosa]|uniref:Odorant receptor Or2 n=1 Tax=Habropoda laboriosa TaxID=597456 RepID=A0A0L7QLJ5_9HYME|nr:Odorant receptor Or2 [Habropoda laboriosa]